MRNSDINALVNCAIPLIVATKNCEEQTVGRLLSEGAEVDAGAGAGEITALYVATHMNHIGIATLLLKAGAGANRAHHQHGGAALHLAAQAGYDELAELLLQYRADPNARTNVEGYTALDYAVQANHPKLVRLLGNDTFLR